MSLAGQVIKRARSRSRLSQRQVARRAGTSQAAISRIERGLEKPTLERLERILAGLGWRPVIDLVPIAEYGLDRDRLLADAKLDPDTRLERGLKVIGESRPSRRQS